MIPRPAPARPSNAVSVESSRIHFDAWNEAHRQGEFDQIDPEIRDRGLAILEGLAAARLERPRILEVGCGTGWLASRLAAIGPVTGIDLSPRAIEIARSRGIPARFIAGDFLDVDLAGETFDAVVCVETLFYVPDPRAFVDRIATLLRPGGWLGLTCVNRFVYERSSDIGPPAPGQPRNWMNTAEVVRLLGPRFELLSSHTVHPRGDRGVLRLVNSWKLNQAANGIFGPRRVRRAKEWAGLGGGLIVLARRRDIGD